MGTAGTVPLAESAADEAVISIKEQSGQGFPGSARSCQLTEGVYVCFTAWVFSHQVEVSINLCHTA